MHIVLRSLLIVSVTAISAGAFAPRPADASCGDWLAHPDQDRSGEVADQVDHSSDHRPCDGPLCGRAPMAPFPIPTSPQVDRYHHEACLLSARSAQLLLVDTRLKAGHWLQLASGYVRGIDRPPRSWRLVALVSTSPRRLRTAYS